MSQDVVIRTAKRADHAVVLRFHRELYIKHRDELSRPDVQPLLAYKDLDGTLRDDVEGLLSGRDTKVLLAEREGQPVGYVTGHVEVDPRRVLTRKGVVEDWFVAKGERGQGTGKLLLDTLVEGFRRDGCQVVESGTWAFNEGARRAHAKAGFLEIEVKFRKRI
ncbi:MAG: family N-acetyltransferase [Myxococcaceae bacterium]|nr:family N-acetyltransferase [Myxococcaceae bacterium]